MTEETRESMAAPCSCLQSFLLKQNTQLEVVKSRSSMNFSVVILEIFVKLVQVDILLLMTSIVTATGMLVKRALRSNDNKVSSSGLMERFLILLIKSVLTSIKDGIFLQ